MKFKVNARDLLNVSKNASNIVASRTTMDILKNFFLELDNKRLSIATSDLDIFATTGIEVESLETGKCCVESKHFMSILKSIGNKPIEVNVDEKSFEIKTAKGKFKIPYMLDMSDVPNFPEVEISNNIPISFSDFARYSFKVYDYISEKDSRTELTGMNVVSDGKMVKICGTDGHIVSKVEIDVESETKTDIIVSKKTIDILRKIEDTGENVYVSDNFILFLYKNTQIYSRLLNSTYPNIEQVIPYGNDKELVFNKAELIDSLKRVMVCADDTFKIIMSCKEGEVILSARSIIDNSQSGESISSEGSIDHIWSFNGKYMLIILDSIDSDKITMKFSETLIASLVLGDDSNNVGAKALSLIMPMKIL